LSTVQSYISLTLSGGGGGVERGTAAEVLAVMVTSMDE